MWAQSSSLVHKVSGSEEQVETISLDDYVRQEGIVPSVIKIDVEGAEYDVLVGAERLLREHSPVLALEYWPRGRTTPSIYWNRWVTAASTLTSTARSTARYYRKMPRTNIVANVVAVPRRAEHVYARVRIQALSEIPIVGGSRSQEFALEPGRYHVQMEFDGPEDDPMTLLIVSGGENLMLFGGSVKECREWGRVGMVMRVSDPAPIRAEVIPGNKGGTISLRRLSRSSIDGIRKPADRDSNSVPAAVSISSSEPRLSIVTPTFNCAKLIGHCIESVLAQGYHNFEHIIVDGASKDGPVEVLRKHPHVRWISEPDNGESEALNKGLRMVTGDVIGWLNADDQYVPGALRTVAKAFQANRSCHLVYGKTIFIDEQGNPTNWVMPYAPLNLAHFPARWFRLDLFQPSIFFSAHLLKNVGLFREDLRYGVDYEYRLRIADKGYTFHYLDHVFSLAMIYRSGGKTETPYSIKAREWLEILQQFLPHLSVGEQIHFWKDFYLFRVRMAREYDKAQPSIPLPESTEALTGMLLAHKETGFLQSNQLQAILQKAPYAANANTLGTAAEIFRINGKTLESQELFDQALALDRTDAGRDAEPSAASARRANTMASRKLSDHARHRVPHARRNAR